MKHKRRKKFRLKKPANFDNCRASSYLVVSLLIEMEIQDEMINIVSAQLNIVCFISEVPQYSMHSGLWLLEYQVATASGILHWLGTDL